MILEVVRINSSSNFLPLVFHRNSQNQDKAQDHCNKFDLSNAFFEKNIPQETCPERRSIVKDLENTDWKILDPEKQT